MFFVLLPIIVALQANAVVNGDPEPFQPAAVVTTTEQAKLRATESLLACAQAELDNVGTVSPSGQTCRAEVEAYNNSGAQGVATEDIAKK